MCRLCGRRSYWNYTVHMHVERERGLWTRRSTIDDGGPINIHSHFYGHSNIDSYCVWTENLYCKLATTEISILHVNSYRQSPYSYATCTECTYIPAGGSAQSITESARPVSPIQSRWNISLLTFLGCVLW